MNRPQLTIHRRSAKPEAAERLRATGVDPILAQLYAARGVERAEILDTRLSALPAPSGLKSISGAAARLSDAIDRRQRICIVADYDADGATACAVGLRGLRGMGAVVDYLVPNRFEFGYGLTPEIVRLAWAERAPALIVTVDNGIASFEGVEEARRLGIDVLITDHHLPAAQNGSSDWPQIPNAIVVNPNQPGCTFESKALAGVGVMFYVLMALRAHRNAKETNLAQWLDLVAMGTVADVVPLDRVNRILVDQGIKRMRAGAMCAGIAALFAVSGKDATRASSQDLGFILGPRINAAGRLADISLGIECLTTDDPGRATEIAAELDALNRERRDIEAGMRDEAMAALAKIEAGNPENYTVSLFDASWHQGVIGIVAGRIKDARHRPTIVFAPGNEDTEIKGSGRSIAGFHIRDALDLVSKQNPTLMKKFGGHAMAAGLTIPAAQFSAFSAAFERVARNLMSPEQLTRAHVTDGSFFAPQVSVAVVEAINMQVWGQSFPAPLFDDDFAVVDQKIVGVKHSKLRVRRGEKTLTALLWNHTDALPPHIHAVYRLVVNSFNGKESVEIMIEAWAAQ